MEDIKKVMNGLEHCSDRSCKCDECAYWNPNRTIDDEYCGAKVNRDALELLKRQQAEIERLKQEKADAIERIKRMAEETPYTPAKTETDGIYLSGKYWGMKDALDILKGKDGELE